MVSMTTGEVATAPRGGSAANHGLKVHRAQLALAGGTAGENPAGNVK